MRSRVERSARLKDGERGAGVARRLPAVQVLVTMALPGISEFLTIGAVGKGYVIVGRQQANKGRHRLQRVVQPAALVLKLRRTFQRRCSSSSRERRTSS